MEIRFLFLVLIKILTSLILLAQCNQFSVMHHPDSVHFVTPTNKLQSSEIPATVLSLFGLSSDIPMKWDGLLAGNIFKRPKAVVMFAIDSTKKDIPIKNNINNFDLQQDSGDLSMQVVNNKLEKIDWRVKPLTIDSSMDNQLFDTRSSYSELVNSRTIDSIQSDLEKSDWMKQHKTGSLVFTSDVDLAFIAEMFVISETIKKIKDNKSVLKSDSPSFFHFKISTLKALEDKPAYDDAINLLNDVFSEARDELISLFSGNVVVAVVTMNPDLGTKLMISRHLQEANATIDTESKFNRAPKYTYMYPVIFNIVLWFMIAFVITLTWISWSIWHMDPGRDSVIYRMTTQRLKRD
ncbi:hypothetical protein HELRODRAFT_184035 [Helobdella robusta]|uniref:Renin receptor n=1 Tax=Helobdella robusta TaxID=6412 RepID=T1FKG8_HELRO|nr:hypothetical protein HELRODRAFT_184035 [Helobdella robusta]ESO08686.1 hypothetical protein HELRODRAFT_184035 [Helobdella robusta]